MAKNQSTYTLKIDAELGNLQSIVTQAKKKLETLMASSDAPKGIEKTFEKISGLLDEISNKAGRELDLKGFAKVDKDLGVIEDGFASIIRLIGNFKDLSNDVQFSFLKADEQEKVKEITKALKDYGEAAEEAAKKLKALETAKSATDKNKSKVDKAQKRVGDLQSQKNTKTAKLEGTKKKLEAAQTAPKINAQDVAKYEALIISLEAELIELDKSLAAATTELADANEVYKTSSTALDMLQKGYNELADGTIQKMRDQVAKLGGSLEDLDGKEPAEQAEILANKLEELRREALATGEHAFKELLGEMHGIGPVAKSASEEIKEATKSIEKMDEVAAQREAFENRIKSFLGIQGAAQVMRAALRDAMATITELDATMAEMAVVTDLTVGDYWDQLPEYSKRASELGVSINAAYEAATLYYQQGLKTNEVNAISAETLKMARIAGLDAAEATDKMTAALRGFNMELNELSAQRVSDVYSELAAITAADVNEISTAMTKTASIASSAGMEFETTAAFLSQIIETTRESAETAGTAMKTVIARFQELKKAPDEIGEIDGEIVDANAIETALRSVGVSLRDANGQFRELDDVFLELSSKWDGLDKNTQRYIATIAAGSRQQSRFIAMMSDYARTQELVTAANNSAGASNKQFEKTMDSLGFKMERLKNAWHEFTMGIMESDLVKTGVDVLTKFLEIINKATSGIDGLGGSIVKILGILTVFKIGQNIFEKLRTPLVNFFADIVRQAGQTGEDAARAAKKGVEKVTQLQNNQRVDGAAAGLKAGYFKDSAGKVHRANGQYAKKGEGARTGWTTVGDKLIGLDKWQIGRDQLGKISAGRKEVNAKKAALEGATPEEAKKLQKEYDELIEKQNELEATGHEAWKNIGDGIAQVGQSVIGLGAGMSALGGILSSLGLEQFGEGVAAAGNYVMITGAIITSVVPLVKLLGTTFTVAGTEISVAGWIAQGGWLWLTAIIAAIGLLVGAAVMIGKSVKEASPEAQMQKAQEALDSATESADAATEAYEGLKSSLDGLDSNYEALEHLTEGTQKWNEAVNELNSSVLDLITKYPELASLVQHDGGVLRLDVDSTEVQAILNNYEKRSITQQGAALGAKSGVIEAQQQIDFANLDAVKRVQRHRNWASAGKFMANSYWGIDSFINAAKTGGDEELQTATEALAKHTLENGVMSEEGMTNFLRELGVAKDEAKRMAEEFAKDSDALLAYGNSIKEAETQQSALNQAIATQASQLINWEKFGANENTARDSALSVVDSAKVEQQKAKINKRYADDDSKETEAELKKYMEGLEGVDQVKKIKDNKIVYIDTEGQRQSVDKETYLKQMKDSKLTEEVASLMNNAATALAASGNESVQRLFSKDGGKAMLAGDMAELSKDELESIFSAMGEEAKKVWGEDSTKFIEEYNARLKEGKKLYDTANAKLKEFGINLADENYKFMSADIANIFAEKLSNAYDVGGQSAGAALQSNYESIISSIQGDDKKKAVTELINATDWSDQESIRGMQYALQEQYGIGAEEAKNFADSMITANKAMSSLSASADIYGALYQATKKCNVALEKFSDLQWSYERALKNGADAVELANNLEEQRAKALEAGQAALEAYEAARDEQADKYTEGTNIEGVNFTQYVKFNTETGEYDFSEFNERLKEYEENDPIREKALEWAAKLEKANELSKEQIDIAKKSYEELEALREQGEEAYWSLYTQTEQALLKGLEDSISIQQDILDATEDANAKLINKIQEQIDQERQARESEKAETEITDLYNQAAYMRMDTSGANTLSILDIEKQIADKEQAYSDSLIDQSIQQLQDANKKAEEQRERQIALAEQQLTAYKNSEAFQSKVTEFLNGYLNSFQSAMDNGIKFDPKDTTLGTAFSTAFTTGLNGMEEREFWDAIKTDTVNAANYLTTGVGDADAATLLSEIRNNTKREALDEYDYNQAVTTQNTRYGLHGISFEIPTMLDEKGNTIYDINAWAAANTRAESQKNKYEGADAKQLAALTRAGLGSEVELSDYYQDIAPLMLSDELAATAPTYAEWINTKYTDQDNTKTMKEKYSTEGAIGATTKGFNDKENRDFDLTLWGEGSDNVTDTQVKTGKRYSNGEELDALWEETATEPMYLSGKRVVLKNNTLYVSGGGRGSNWYEVMDDDKLFDPVPYDSDDPNDRPNGLINYAKNFRKNNPSYGYKTGGLADFTGPAWLDGTPSRPEYILNAAQTERFFSLVDVLEGYDTDKNNNKSSGDNYFDIEINVEKLENDYDVEQMANKIRSMIYDDATYRNVNAIKRIR